MRQKFRRLGGLFCRLGVQRLFAGNIGCFPTRAVGGAGRRLLAGDHAVAGYVVRIRIDFHLLRISIACRGGLLGMEFGRSAEAEEKHEQRSDCAESNSGCVSKIGHEQAALSMGLA